MLTELTLSMLLPAGIGGAQPAPVRYAHVALFPDSSFQRSGNPSRRRPTLLLAIGNTC